MIKPVLYNFESFVWVSSARCVSWRFEIKNTFAYHTDFKKNAEHIL